MIDVGRPHGDSGPLAFLPEGGKLVGAASVKRHRGSDELLGIIGLQIGCLVGHQRIGGGVRFVESIARKGGNLVEHIRGKLFGEIIRHRTGDEGLSLLVHLRLDLLAHGAPQKVGPAKRIAGKDTRRLLHLFLIDHDAVGLGQHRLQRRMHIGHK